MNFSDECATLAFYGIDATKERMVVFYNGVVELFSSLGHPATSLGVTGKGYGPKLTAFLRADNKLRKTQFLNVNSVSIYAGIPGDSVPNNQNVMSASMDTSCAVIVARSSILSLQNMLPLLAKMLKNLNPIYGIGYNRSYKKGPWHYAVGVGYSYGIQEAIESITGSAREEKSRISKWSQIGMEQEVYRQGLLRDVYAWNILTAPQLQKAVNGVPLKNWIQADKFRGKLNILNDSVTLWEVEEEKSSEIRSVLWDAGVIFDWRKFVPQHTEPLNPDESLSMVLDLYKKHGVAPDDVQVLSGKTGKEILPAQVKEIANKSRKKKA